MLNCTEWIAAVAAGTLPQDVLIDQYPRVVGRRSGQVGRSAVRCIGERRDIAGAGRAAPDTRQLPVVDDGGNHALARAVGGERGQRPHEVPLQGVDDRVRVAEQPVLVRLVRAERDGPVCVVLQARRRLRVLVQVDRVVEAELQAMSEPAVYREL